MHTLFYWLSLLVGSPPTYEVKWSRKAVNFEANGSYPRNHLKKRSFDNTGCDFTNYNYQLVWQGIMLNGEMQANHPDMLRSSILVVGEKKDIREVWEELDDKRWISNRRGVMNIWMIGKNSMKRHYLHKIFTITETCKVLLI